MKMKIFLTYIFSSLAILGFMKDSKLDAAPTDLESKQITFFSQASQDRFVYTLLYLMNEKDSKGYFIDIGREHPTFRSNTYFFEKEFEWEDLQAVHQEPLHHVESH